MEAMVQRPERKSGLSLGEVVAVSLIVAALAAVVLPAFGSAIERRQQRICCSNLHRIGAALSVYIEDNAGKLMWNPYNTMDYPNPTRDKQQSYILCLEPYLKSAGVWACPSFPGRTSSTASGRAFWIHPDYPIDMTVYKSVGYGFDEPMIAWGGRARVPDAGKGSPAVASAVREPAEVGIFADAEFPYSYAIWVNATGGYAGDLASYDGTGHLYWPWTNPKSTYWTYGWARHSGGNNFAYLDGHAAYSKPVKCTPSGSQDYTYGYYPNVRLL